MNRFMVLSKLAAACLVVGLSGAAAAGSWNIQGSAGHMWNGSGLGQLRMIDGEVCAPNNIANSFTIWVVPIPLTATNLNYTGTQFRAGGNALPPQGRMVSFTSQNAVFQIGSFLDNDSIGTVFVPPDGTLFTQHEIASGASAMFFGCLDAVKVTF